MRTVLIILLAFISLSVSGKTLYEMLLDKGCNGKVVYCTNNHSVLTQEQIEKLNHMLVKDFEMGADTVKVTLRGRSALELQHELEPSYRADLRVGENRCRYTCDEIPSFMPKTSQYMLSDTCFYLTFDLAPRFQTSGERVWLSMFMALDSIPGRGDVYNLVSVRDAVGDSTIVGWNRGMGDVSALQIMMMPDKSSRDYRDLIPLKGGKVKIEQFKIHKSGLASIKLRLTLEAVIKPGEDIVRVCGDINLMQIQKTDLQPCFFETDFAWGNNQK